MLLPNELQTIQEVVEFLRQELAAHPKAVSGRDQEHIAAGIVGLGVSDKFDEWRQGYPKLQKIFDLASDLEWSNVASENDILAYWDSIARLTDELDQQVKSEVK